MHAGACSTGKVVLPEDKQQRLLESEGVVFDERGRCKLERYLWIPEEHSKKESSKFTLFKS